MAKSSPTKPNPPLRLVQKPKKVNQLARVGPIRTALGYTQQQVAERLGTTQQSIARWETGKAEPSLAQLRDLAIEFGVSVADIVNNLDPIQTSHYDNFSSDAKKRLISGFWGHVGVRLPGHTFSRWYPISAYEYERVYRRIAESESDTPWISVATLSNRELVINLPNLHRIWFLNDDSDRPSGDWKDVAEQQSMEFFNALDHLGTAQGGFDTYAASDQLTAAVSKFIVAFNKASPQSSIDDFLHTATVHFIDGNILEFRGESENLEDIVMGADMNFENEIPMLRILDGDHDWDSFIPKARIAMIEIPLLDLLETPDRDAAASVEADTDLD
jgi:transcriptional regulator with XRE-family HTH domain